MKRIAISVEGQTEERFMKEILQPYFWTKDIHIEPKILITRKTLGGPDDKGGIIKISRAIKEIKNLLNSFELVTTFYDLYRLHESFLNKELSLIQKPYDKVNAIEKFFYHQIGNHHFIPYIQLHEFEAFLFIDGQITSYNLLDCNKLLVKSVIEKTLREFDNNPELINDSTTTAPSKRILNLDPSYQKGVDTISICKELGLDKIKNNCNHFKEWIEKLEKS